MKFTKMQGAGNDFIIINNMDLSIPREKMSKLAIRLCHRRFGVGADGMMIVEPSKTCDYKMVFINADGSFGEMCGNGARCIARYGFDNGLAEEIQRVETPAGIVIGKRVSENKYCVQLNSPSTIVMQCIAEGYDCFYDELGTPGLPHAVLFIDWENMEKEELAKLGKSLRYSKIFPKGANINFACPVSQSRYKAITYERGVEDFTYACGTGSGSIALAAKLLGFTESDDIEVEMPGGLLEISISKNKDDIWKILLTGPTDIAFTGNIEI